MYQRLAYTLLPLDIIAQCKYEREGLKIQDFITSVAAKTLAYVSNLEGCREKDFHAFGWSFELSTVR